MNIVKHILAKCGMLAVVVAAFAVVGLVATPQPVSAQSVQCTRRTFNAPATLQAGGYLTEEQCRASNTGTKPIPNGSCTVSCPYTDGCACPSYCNNIGAVDPGQNCGGNWQPDCDRGNGRPVGCSCTTNGSCASQTCQQTSTGMKCVPPGTPTGTCTDNTGRPTGCACSTNSQCSNFNCADTTGGKKCVDPNGPTCGGNTRGEGCTCQNNTQCTSGRCDNVCLPPIGGGNVGDACNPSSGTANSVVVGGECCGGGVLECQSGSCSAAQGVVGTCQAGGGGGLPNGQGKGEGESCNPSANECASPLSCASSCPASTMKAGQSVCYGLNYIGACGGYNVPGRVCNTLDRGPCNDPACGSVATRQQVCNALGQWECLHTDRCGSVGTRPPGSGCNYDSSCANGYCDRDQEPAICVSTKGNGGSCSRHTQCQSQYCGNGGTCQTNPNGTPLSCGNIGHGKFAGCGNLHGFPSDYDCFCFNGSISCAYDADKQSCAAPAGSTTPTPTVGPSTPPTNPPTNPPTTPPTPTPTPPVQYYCNSGCTTNAQCKTADSRFTCADTEQGKRCRLETNVTSAQCRPAVGPQCLSIRMVDPVTNADLTGDPVAGQTLRFICGEVSGAARYVFRVFEPTNTSAVDLQSTGNISANYTVPENNPGRYVAQCQICTEAAAADPDNSSCLPYENPFPDNRLSNSSGANDTSRDAN